MRTRDENKENIVKLKAIELFVEVGFDGFSMQKLAKAAGVSPATLYIYYKDKEDLILKLGIEESQKMTTAIMKNFDPEMSFSEGLKIQWENRARFQLENPLSSYFFEQIKHTPYHERIFSSIKDNFKEVMGIFIKNAIENKELQPMSIEVFWSVAYAPLYNLIRFHQQGYSVGVRPFAWSDEMMYQALDLVLKALKP